jgi:hypothetical protein
VGTSGAWGGSGSAAAKSLRNTVASQGDQSEPANAPGTTVPPRIDPNDLRDAVRLLDGRTSSTSSGPSGSRVAAGSARGASRAGGGHSGSGGARRSSTRTASTAGRAIAGAIAYRTGDRATLNRLGLDFDELSRLGDPFEVVRRIVDMACGSAESTIADHERRLMAADVGERLVIDLDLNAGIPTQEIAALAVSAIVSELILSECGDILLSSDGTVSEQDIRDAAAEIVNQSEFPVTGLTESDFAAAIESGLDRLRKILGID